MLDSKDKQDQSSFKSYYDRVLIDNHISNKTFSVLLNNENDKIFDLNFLSKNYFGISSDELDNKKLHFPLPTYYASYEKSVLKEVFVAIDFLRKKWDYIENFYPEGETKIYENLPYLENSSQKIKDILTMQNKISLKDVSKNLDDCEKMFGLAKENILKSPLKSNTKFLYIMSIIFSELYSDFSSYSIEKQACLGKYFAVMQEDKQQHILDLLNELNYDTYKFLQVMPPKRQKEKEYNS